MTICVIASQNTLHLLRLQQYTTPTVLSSLLAPQTFPSCTVLPSHARVLVDSAAHADALVYAVALQCFYNVEVRIALPSPSSLCTSLQFIVSAIVRAHRQAKQPSAKAVQKTSPATASTSPADALDEAESGQPQQLPGAR